MTDPIYTTQARIKVYRGYLLIPGSKRLGIPDTFVHEQPFYNYERFYKLWQQAMSRLNENQTPSLTDAFLADTEFKNLIQQALEAVGIEEPWNLKLPQINELILKSESFEGGTGEHSLLFKLHQDFPKVRAAQKPQNPAAQESASSAKPGIWRRLLLGVSNFCTKLL